MHSLAGLSLSALLAVAAFGCGKPAATTTGADASSSAASPPGGRADFHLEMTAGARPGLSPERVIVEGTRAMVFRPQAVQEGQSIGVFGVTIAEDERARIESSARAAAGGGPPVAAGAPSAFLLVRSGGQRLETRIALPATSPEASALLTALDRLQQRALASPERAFRLEVSPPAAPPQEGRPAPMRIALVHAGTLPVTVTFDAGAPRLEATEPRPPPDPNVTPLPVVWDRVSPDASQRGPFALAPGGRAEIEVVATFEDAGRYEVWARFEGAVTMTSPGQAPVQMQAAVMSRPIAVAVRP